jgi:hypothetical protein
VLSVWSAPRKGRTVFSVWSVPRLYNEIPRITEGFENQLPVGHIHRKFVLEEELKVSLRTLSVCLYMCHNYSNLESVKINCSYDQ